MLESKQVPDHHAIHAKRDGVVIVKTLLIQIVIAFLVATGCQAAGVTEIDIGSRLELFIDRYLIDQLDGAELKLHSPQMVSRATNPIQGYYMTVIKDHDIYRAYYRGVVPGFQGKRQDGHLGEITCYAESRDGHDWDYPDLGIHPVNSPAGNNVILANQTPFSHNFSPFLDHRPGVDKDKRFKALAGIHSSKGLCAFVSADGLHWEMIQEQPVITSEAFAFDSQNVSFWSTAENTYVCYFRTWVTPHGRLRTISRTTSKDFLHWSRPVPMNPNLPGEHLYTSNTHPYFRAPHIYIALPTRYLPDRGSSTDILFMTSRAGSYEYDRAFTEALIRPGIDPERWGNRSNYAALNVVPTGPGEMSIYHGPSGHRYVMRTDGFVSVNAGSTGGRMTTKPFVFAGKDLVLNYSTSAAGQIRVEVLHPDGRVVSQHSLADCKPIIGDTIEGIVSWQNDRNLSGLSGKPIRLRFELNDADLYSLRFR